MSTNFYYGGSFEYKKILKKDKQIEFAKLENLPLNKNEKKLLKERIAFEFKKRIQQIEYFLF